LNLRMALGVEFPDQANTATHLAALPKPDPRDPWITLDSSGEEPWTPATIAAANYTELMRAERRVGWRPSPHVGADVLRGVSADDATDTTLAAYETVDRENTIRDQRWYIEHAPFATPAEMDRMARLGVIVSVQDQGYRPPNPAPMPPDRMAHWNPVRSLLNHNITVIAGSDYNGPNPIERAPNNPMIPFYFYVTRTAETGAVTSPDEKITREQALRLFTVNAAYATFQEAMKGKIASGMLADFVILNQDLMTVPDEKILATRPLATFVGGKRVYAAPGARF
jgi:predicted amidohydrolase YtcJ